MVQYLTDKEAAQFVDEGISPLKGQRVQTTDLTHRETLYGTVIKSFYVHGREKPHAFVMVADDDGYIFITRCNNVVCLNSSRD